MIFIFITIWNIMMLISLDEMAQGVSAPCFYHENKLLLATLNQEVIVSVCLSVFQYKTISLTCLKWRSLRNTLPYKPCQRRKIVFMSRVSWTVEMTCGDTMAPMLRNQTWTTTTARFNAPGVRTMNNCTCGTRLTLTIIPINKLTFRARYTPENIRNHAAR